ncbi:MlaC/ttg2D family ABC transporter substrate-binding protein [Congregibacter litoralis]|uniref:ABC-type (Unclassified) transport system, auxiliary component n=1 Tax=Congregibacter litoralis KT71 TaxID=314285 RepID=A4A5D1_9GAMM|nr:ABC transporter substrate-binding protein [Congregibacter litoralis]EAQ99002.1 ABC-type (unclassified) transport system, auxiliary component [Congregibacter litoralis KT71]
MVLRSKWTHSITAAFALLTGLLMLSLAPSLHAQDDEAAAGKTARQTLRETTDKVLAVIEEARSYVDEDTERYYQAVHEVLDPIVDFRGFARGVMGEYATGARYRSLDEAGRDKLRDQLERFTETMRVGLVRTYSKGLLAFGGSRVELDDSPDAGDSADRAMLKQLIYSDEAQPYVVVYFMARDKSGDWKMRNLVVENVNLGQIYRSQFESAARRYDGDLDQVIANWTVEDATD